MSKTRHHDYRMRCPECNSWTEFDLSAEIIGKVISCDCSYQWLVTNDGHTTYNAVREGNR